MAIGHKVTDNPAVGEVVDDLLSDLSNVADHRTVFSKCRSHFGTICSSSNTLQTSQYYIKHTRKLKMQICSCISPASVFRAHCICPSAMEPSVHSWKHIWATYPRGLLAPPYPMSYYLTWHFCYKKTRMNAKKVSLR